ncbi:LysR family transcriptional regulator [Shewanella maritima]|uniref:LysR family transcriptional regulator n=1 Tax=Shewanella maritima TaxID=2520507 RepID=UPI0037364F66
MSEPKHLFDGMYVFTQVVELGNFSAAAEKLGSSTSYISKEVTKLEKRIGIRLLQRTTRTLNLTEEGKVFHLHCQQIVADAQQTLDLLHHQKATPTGTLKISCPVTLGNRYLQPIISQYLHQFPKVKLDIELNDRHVDVVQGGYDLVIRATKQLDDSTLVCKKISQFKGIVIASPQYLAKHGTPNSPEELKQHRCICYSNLKQPNRWSFTDKHGKTTTVEVPDYINCTSAEMELAMTIDHHGICMLPEFVIKDEIIQGKLVTLFNDYQQVQIDVFAIYPSKRFLSAKVRAFIDLMSQMMPNN